MVAFLLGIRQQEGVLEKDGPQILKKMTLAFHCMWTGHPKILERRLCALDGTLIPNDIIPNF